MKNSHIQYFRNLLPRTDPLRLHIGKPSRPEIPPGLHQAIMAEVRHHQFRNQAPSQQASFTGWPRVAAGLTAALALFAACWLLWLMPRPGSGGDGGLIVVAAALHTAEQIPQQAPETLISPLQTELERLRTDLQSSAELLIASLP